MISEIGSIAMVNAIMFVVAIGVYLVVVRNSNPLKLTQALLAGLSVVALSSTGIFFASALYPLRLHFVVSFIVYLPCFLVS
jgi:hypothetical protein